MNPFWRWRTMRDAIRRQAGLPVLTWAVWMIAGGAVWAEDVRFGNVRIGEDGVDQVRTLFNPSSSPMVYTITPPADPFVIRQGSLTGTIPPMQSGQPIPSTSIVFGFNRRQTIAPRMGSTHPTELFTQRLTGTQNGLPTLLFDLSATVYGPQPTNVFKRAAYPWERKLYGIGQYVESVAEDALWYLGTGQYLDTTVRFESSTKNIRDLDSIQIREKLALDPNGGAIFCPVNECPLKTVTGYPNYCGTENRAFFTLPAPWIPHPKGKTHYSVPYYQPFLGAGVTPPALEWELGEERYFMDFHGIGSFRKPLVDGHYSMTQTYEWTAPWLKDANGCQYWSPMLSDVIERSMGSTGLPFIWGCSIRIHTVVDQTKRTIQIQPEIREAFPIPSLQLSLKRDALDVQWDVQGAILQSAPSLDGPWTDMDSSTNAMAMSLPIETSAGARFLRLKLND